MLAWVRSTSVILLRQVSIFSLEKSILPHGGFVNYHSWYRAWKAKLKNLSALVAVRYHEDHHNSLVIEFVAKHKDNNYVISFLSKNIPREDLERNDFETIHREWFLTFKMNKELTIDQIEFDRISEYMTELLGENVSRSLRRKDATNIFEFYCHFWNVFPSAQGVDHFIECIGALIDGTLSSTIQNSKHRETASTAVEKPAQVFESPVRATVDEVPLLSNYNQWLEKWCQSLDRPAMFETTKFLEPQNEFVIKLSGAIEGSQVLISLVTGDLRADDFLKKNFEDAIRCWRIHFHSDWKVNLSDNEFIDMVKIMGRFFPMEDNSIDRLIDGDECFAFKFQFMDTVPQSFEINTLVSEFLRLKKEFPQRLKERLLSQPEVVAFQKNIKLEDSGSDDERRERIYHLVKQQSFSHQFSRDQIQDLVSIIFSDTWGLGPLDQLLSDNDVFSVFINSTAGIFISQQGSYQRAKSGFVSREQLQRVLQRLQDKYVDHQERTANTQSARFKYKNNEFTLYIYMSGADVYVDIQRLINHQFTLEHFVKSGSLTNDIKVFLESIPICESNLLISFTPNTNGREVQKSIVETMPHNKRIVHFGRAPFKFENIERNYVHIFDQRQMGQAMNHLSPDILVVEGDDDKVVWPSLRAAGEKLMIYSIAAHTPEQALDKIKAIALLTTPQLTESSLQVFCHQIFPIVVQVSRLEDGSTKVIRVSEVCESLHAQQEIVDIFVFKKMGIDESTKRVMGEFIPTGHIPQFVHRALETHWPSLPYDLSLFSHMRKAS